MSSSVEIGSILRTSWVGTSSAANDDDYLLLARVDVGYAARTRNGQAALVIPLEHVDAQSIGRRAAGCELAAIRRASFRFEGNEWEGSAAVLVCHDNEVIDAFLVLASDVVVRAGAKPTWAQILELVSEWQSLLTIKGKTTPEAEIGLWGELWLAASASDVPLLIRSWRGPEGDASDFFLDNSSVEVKTSRHRRLHHVSMKQVRAPVGNNPAWLLSVWIKEDPVRGRTVADLVNFIEAAYDDRGDLYRRLLRAGYTLAGRSLFTSKFVVLEQPEWYSANGVPTVHQVDPGITEVRYRVQLDPETAADSTTAATLWHHFTGQGYR